MKESKILLFWSLIVHILNQWNNTVMNSNNAVSCQSLKPKQNLVVVNPLQISLHFTEAPAVFLAGIAISVPSSGNTFTNHVQHVAEFYRKHLSQHIISGIAFSKSTFTFRSCSHYNTPFLVSGCSLKKLCGIVLMHPCGVCFKAVLHLDFHWCVFLSHINISLV